MKPVWLDIILSKKKVRKKGMLLFNWQIMTKALKKMYKIKINL